MIHDDDVHCGKNDFVMMIILKQNFKMKLI